jgi:hypothetical protein
MNRFEFPDEQPAEIPQHIKDAFNATPPTIFEPLRPLDDEEDDMARQELTGCGLTVHPDLEGEFLISLVAETLRRIIVEVRARREHTN